MESVEANGLKPVTVEFPDTKLRVSRRLKIDDIELGEDSLPMLLDWLGLTVIVLESALYRLDPNRRVKSTNYVDQPRAVLAKNMGLRFR